MIAFLRLALSIFDQATKRRLLLGGAWSLLLALLEALGLALVAPLLLVLSAATAHEPPPHAIHWIVSILGGNPSPGRIAALLGIAIFAALTVKSIVAILVLRWNIGLVLQSEAAMSARLLSAYLYAPYRFHLDRNSSETQRSVHDSVRRVYQDALIALVGAQADAVVMTVVVIVLFVLQPALAALSVVYFALVAYGYQRLIHSRIDASAAAVHDDWRSAFQIVQQSLNAVREITLLHRQEQMIGELRETKLRMALRQRMLILIYQLPRYYLEVALIVGFGAVGLFLFTTRPVDSAVAALGLFLAAGFRLLPSINRVLIAAGAARSALPALRQITTDLHSLESGNHPVFIEAGRIELAHLELRQVCFGYDPSRRPVLLDISLRVDRGQSVAFVGHTGAGKTTLLDLILGLLEPTSGDVLVNGTPIAGVIDAWQCSIGFVPQNVMLIDDSLLSNIAFGVEYDQIEHSAVQRAVAMAQLEDFVAELPEGLATIVGENGVRLSGGQRQRIGIARALYTSPSVLVLDEATSSLDSDTEARITETLESLHGDLTIIIVAHRLSTIRRCDRLFFLSDGNLIASGPFDVLNETCSEFANLVRLADLRAGHLT